MVGALVACGVPPWLMSAHSGGEDIEGVLDANGAHPRSSDRSAGAVYKLHGAVPSLGPGSWKLALGSLARPIPPLAGLLRHGLAPARLHLDRSR